MNSNIRKYTYLILTILIISFIFYNSTRNGTDSANTSNGILIFLNNILKGLGFNFSVKSLFLRKFAHFAEFFVLGVFIMFTFEAFTGQILKNLGFVLFFSLLVPVLDETIQIFSVGRSSQVSDILLDFSGSLTGIIYVSTFLYLKNKLKK